MFQVLIIIIFLKVFWTDKVSIENLIYQSAKKVQ